MSLYFSQYHNVEKYHTARYLCSVDTYYTKPICRQSEFKALINKWFSLPSYGNASQRLMVHIFTSFRFLFFLLLKSEKSNGKERYEKYYLFWYMYRDGKKCVEVSSFKAKSIFTNVCKQTKSQFFLHFGYCDCRMRKKYVNDIRIYIVIYACLWD